MTELQQHYKIRKEHVLIKFLFKKVPPYILYCKNMVKAYYAKGVQKQPFADDLKNSCS